MVDIDVEEDGGSESDVSETASASPQSPQATNPTSAPTTTTTPNSQSPQEQTGKFASLATPAVRRLSKELNIDIKFVPGSGKDGRVLKEDVLSFHANGGTTPAPAKETPIPSSSSSSSITPQFPSGSSLPTSTSLKETVVPLTPIQSQMFKSMTNSLSIPHFLYTEEVGIDSLTQTRTKINNLLKKGALGPELPNKMSYMPFFIKAMSIALKEFPIVNSRVTFDSTTGKPQLVHRPSHNIGIAMDTPSGLIVPNIKNVQNLSILEISQELNRLQVAGSSGKFSSADLQGGTISISNIGNVGGTYLMPVIVDSQVAIVGIGKSRIIPSYNESMQIVPKQVMNTSWSGDHRVLDGMTMARMADRFKQLLEDPELMILNIR